MRVSNLRCGERPSSADCVRVSADVSYDDRPGFVETLWFEVPAALGDKVSLSADPWLAATLPLACRNGEPLHIDAPIDPVLFDSTRELMEWWWYWFPAMKVVQIEGSGSISMRHDAPALTAQFFSGGVDSFFTALRHADPASPIAVDDLLVGWGFDIPLSDGAAFDRLRNSLSSAADRMGKRLVPFSSNIRQTRVGGVPWGAILHGNAMASVALLLQHVYRRVLIPSTDGYRETGPWGSHATVDHLYSTSTMRLIHDGAAYSRFQKVALVATSAAALSVLRVCWRSQSDQNCGVCEKCLRTMLALELCGVLDKAEKFAHARLDPRDIARIHCPRTKQGPLQLYYEEMLAEARQRGRPELARVIARALRASSRRQPVLEALQRLRWVPVVNRIARPLDEAYRRTLIM